MSLRRCILYVPSSSQRMLQRSATVKVDSVVYDLEDSVPDQLKKAARSNLQEVLEKNPHPTAEQFVRINDLGTQYAMDDLTAILEAPRLDGIVLPKVETPDHVLFVGSLLEKVRYQQQTSKSPRKPTILACIESPRSITNLKEICAAGVSQGSLAGLIFAAEDYASSSGVTRTESLLEMIYARQSLVTYTRAYGLSSIDLVCTALQRGSDPASSSPSRLIEECRQGREFGFTGKQAIHPDQVSVIQDIYGPDMKRVKWARRVVQMSKEEAEKGAGAFTIDGMVIDQPVIKEARRILLEAEVAGL